MPGGERRRRFQRPLGRYVEDSQANLGFLFLEEGGYPLGEVGLVAQAAQALALVLHHGFQIAEHGLVEQGLGLGQGGGRALGQPLGHPQGLFHERLSGATTRLTRPQAWAVWASMASESMKKALALCRPKYPGDQRGAAAVGVHGNADVAGVEFGLLAGHHDDRRTGPSRCPRR